MVSLVAKVTSRVRVIEHEYPITTRLDALSLIEIKPSGHPQPIYPEHSATNFNLDALRQSILAPIDDGQTASSVALPRMRDGLDKGRKAIRSAFELDQDGEAAQVKLSQLMDVLIVGILDFSAEHLYPLANPTLGEEISVLAVGGYGRGELAPGSDIDLLFLYPYKPTPYLEQIAEFLLYKLWDLGLKVGQAVRSIDECIRLARNDLTVQTSILEARLIWGSKRLSDQLNSRFRNELVAGREPEFIEAKLAERDTRHERMGDSRYLLEPNIKDGKGGLRDLHTLMWIGRFLFNAQNARDLIEHEVLTRSSLTVFRRSRRFLFMVRCQLHYLTGRSEDRLTFDLQPQIAEHMKFRETARTLAVERFMKRYYLVANDVGSLTRIVCAALEEQHRRRPRFQVPRFGLGRRRIGGFIVHGNRLALDDPKLFEKDPRAILEFFQLAQVRELELHPMALQSVSQNLTRIDTTLRNDKKANETFLDMLCSPKDPARTLIRLNESGVLGRFVPDFGRIIALMQHNLYHVYTVDEHTIRAVGILHQIEKKDLAESSPVATEILPKLSSRKALYVATFLHDLGKGRGGDHSEIGANIARKLCPRLGLSDEETETVEWLVRHHLFFSGYAFKRDMDDPKTINDFIEIIQSPERLKLLLVLTVADIRAVGPGVWNGWKGQLLRELYYETEASMTSSDSAGRRKDRITKSKRRFAEELTENKDILWSDVEIAQYVERHEPGYWLGMTKEAQLRHAKLVHDAEQKGKFLTLDFNIDHFRARTELNVYATSHPGVFMNICGALATCGVSIVDAHIFTTRDGMAVDMLGFQDAERRAAVDDARRLQGIRKKIEKSFKGEIWLEKELKGRRSLPQRADVFTVEPRILVNNQASSTHSVLEVNGRDRPGLLFDLAKALKELGLVITSAHISTYGERVVDVFYIKDVFGMKITQPSKLSRIRNRLNSVLEQV